MQRVYLVSGTLLALLVAALLGGLWVELNTVPAVQVPAQSLPSVNAWDSYLAAAAVMVRSPLITEPGKGSLGEREAVLGRNADALKRLRQALALPYWEPRPSHPWVAPHTEYARVREMAHLLALEASVYHDRGNSSRAVGSALDAIELGCSLSRGAGYIGLLFGFACERVGERSLSRDISGLDAAEARIAARRLEAVFGKRTSLADVLTEEKRRSQLGLLEMMRRPSWVKDATGMSCAGAGRQWPKRLRVIMTSKRQVMTHTTYAFDSLIAEARRPRLGRRSPICSAQDPVSEAVVGCCADLWRFRRYETGDALLLAELGLRAYWAEHGHYPDRLDLLVPGILHRVPHDPFAPRNPLRYRRAGASFVLYSLGPDGKDDGGKPIRDPNCSGRLATIVEEGSEGDMVSGVNW